jgi:hypothetical protein
MEGSHPHFLQRPPEYTHSLRLTFTYAGDQVRLANTERVAMIAPAEATTPPTGEETGYWVEVRDKDGKLLYHRPLHDPLREDLEVFGDEPGEPIYRVSNPTREGEFEVLVPDLPAAAEFSLHGPKPKAREAHGRSVPLLKHDFAELRSWKPEERS